MRWNRHTAEQEQTGGGRKPRRVRAPGAVPASGAPGGAGRGRTGMRAAEDLGQGGQVQMRWLRGEKQGLERPRGGNLCDQRGAGPTEALGKDWEEAATEAETWEEAGRMTRWRPLEDFWARAPGELS